MSIVDDYSPTRPTRLFDVLSSFSLMEGSVVLEGLDCVGKTTAARLLVEATGRLLLTPKRITEVPITLKPYYDYFTLGQYKSFIDLSKESDVVIDRCHFSAFVFGRKDWLDVSFCEVGEVSHLKGVYLYADEEVVKRRMEAKEEPVYLFQKYVEHRELYEQALEKTAINFVKLNTSLLTV